MMSSAIIFARTPRRMDFPGHWSVSSPACIPKRSRRRCRQRAGFERLFGVMFSVLLVKIMLIGLEHHLYNSKYYYYQID